MIIRFATEKDTNELKQLWLDVFCDPQNFVDWNFKNNYFPENVVLAEENGEIAAALHIIEYEMVFLKKRLKAAYISAVATKPKHRKKGFASAVLNAAANHCKNSGFDLCFLMPDINGFYEKFGYFTVLNKNEKILSYKYFKKSKNFIDDLSFNDFFEIYSSVSKNKMLHIKRSKKNSDMIFDDLKSNTGAKTKIYKNKGYIFFDEEENFIRVYELCAKNKVAKNKLLSFAASYKKDILFENRPVMIKILSEKPILKKLKKSAEQMPLSKKDVFINLVL